MFADTVKNAWFLNLAKKAYDFAVNTQIRKSILVGLNISPFPTKEREADQFKWIIDNNVLN
jgi:hypothetical protein